MVCGIGLVAGTEVMVCANIPTIKGGTMNRAIVAKLLRAQQICLENNLMMINLTQSGGADLRQQESVFHEGGKWFYNLAKQSNKQCTTICAVFGSSTAGGAYVPGMSDYCVMVRDKAAVFLAGPPLVKMATGEDATEEHLGGAVMHSLKSGVSDFLAESEKQAILIVRELVACQHRQKKTPYPERHFAAVQPPKYPAEELLGVFDGDIKQPFDVSEIMARIVDGSRLVFFKPEYGKQVVTAFAEIHGFPVGLIGNNGVLTPESTTHATQFIHRCSMEGKPVIFLQNITGFMVGTDSEQAGLIKQGSMLINAVSNCKSPLLTVVLGASYGAGNYAMCGRAYPARFMFSWPCSKCSVMGPDQLAGVLDIVQRKGFEKKRASLTAAQIAKAEKVMNMQKAGMAQMVEKTSDVYYTSSRSLDDGVIDPRDTREVLGLCLSVVYNEAVQDGGIHGVSRL